MGRSLFYVVVSCWLTALAARTAAQPVGAEFRVNTTTTGEQYRASVSSVADGSFVVVWWDWPEKVLGQRFHADGSPTGDEFRVDTGVGGGAGRPAVASDTTGNFVVVYVKDPFDTRDLYGQRFASTGASLGPEFRVNTYTSGRQEYFSVSADARGGFVVAWLSRVPYGEGGNFGQRFAPTGQPAGSEFAIKIHTPQQLGFPSVAHSANGNFVIVWGWSPEGSANADVAGRRYDASGIPLGPEFRVNTSTTGSQGAGAVASDASGSFVVVWIDNSDGGYVHDVIGRRFAPSGDPLGPEFRVNTQSVWAIQPSVSASELGAFVVTWSYCGFFGCPYSPLAGQRFDSAGQPAGAEFEVIKDPFVPSARVAVDLNGDFVVAYGGSDSDYSGIFARRYLGGTHGDVDGNGTLDVVDVLALINYLFAGGPVPLGPADVNGDGSINVTDILYFINHLFANGPPPA